MRFSKASLTAGLASFVGASAGEAIALGSSFAELDVLDEECFRWCTGPGGPFGGPTISAWEVLARAEHDKQVQLLLRAILLEHCDNMMWYSKVE